jgi:hypothetical protein
LATGNFPAVLIRLYRVEKNIVSDPDPYGSRSGRGQKWPTKIENRGRIFKFWSAGFTFEGWRAWRYLSPVAWTFTGGLGIRKLLFLIKKIFNFFSSMNNFFHFLVIKIPDPHPDTHSPEMLGPDPDPHWNQCGSETLEIKQHVTTYFPYE